MEKDRILIKCKDCPYYSGIQCHGHGDFWGECTLLTNTATIFKKIFSTDILDSVVPKDSDCWGFVRDDDSTCSLFDLLKYK